MADQRENNLNQNVFGDINQEAKSWACLAQTFSRSLIVLVCQRFFYLWLLLKIFILQKCMTNQLLPVAVGILCSAAGYILSSPRLKKVSFQQKIVLNCSSKLAFSTKN